MGLGWTLYLPGHMCSCWLTLAEACATVMYTKCHEGLFYQETCFCHLPSFLTPLLLTSCNSVYCRKDHVFPTHRFSLGRKRSTHPWLHYPCPQCISSPLGKRSKLSYEWAWQREAGLYGSAPAKASVQLHAGLLSGMQWVGCPADGSRSGPVEPGADRVNLPNSWIAP